MEKPESILPWAYFYESRGEAFQYIWRNEEGQILFEGIHLTVSIRQWLFSFPLQLVSILKKLAKEARR